MISGRSIPASIHTLRFISFHSPPLVVHIHLHPQAFHLPTYSTPSFHHSLINTVASKTAVVSPGPPLKRTQNHRNIFATHDRPQTSLGRNHRSRQRSHDLYHHTLCLPATHWKPVLSSPASLQGPPRVLHLVIGRRTAWHDFGRSIATPFASFEQSTSVYILNKSSTLQEG
ncbi:hypothetical protein BDV41DRAFT_414798 [Aspergillus transmontanensis]|uniref:Uncharacterized protein n=1 Tax=Aspergillus transmontanensis TaxID=1034304 RepID=A0A5N6WBL6_9EURO|nr:hypothetical protein BDV41DRAFT_414798 [Aspergillus transmontanensis]